MSVVWKEIESKVNQITDKYKDNEMSKLHPESLSAFVSEELNPKAGKTEFEQGDLKVLSVKISPSRPKILWVDYEIGEIDGSALAKILSVAYRNGFEITKMDQAGQVVLGTPDKNKAVRVSFYPQNGGDMDNVMWFQVYNRASAKILEKIASALGKEPFKTEKRQQ
jgi:hypothetical protein